MLAELAVFDPLPLFRVGLLATLGHGGVDLVSREDMEHWSATRGGLLLLTLLDGDEMMLPAEARHGDGVKVVAVLEPFSETRAARALRLGAVNIVARQAPPAEFRRVVDQTRAGRLTVTQEVLRAATALPRTAREGPAPTDEELSWLHALAAGASVSAVAETAQFSERMMYRKLRGLYHRLQVANRTQALILARDEGWL